MKGNCWFLRFYIIMKPLESGDKLHIYSDFSPKNIIKWMNE